MTEKRRLTRLTRMRYYKEAPLLLTWYIKLKGWINWNLQR